MKTGSLFIDHRRFPRLRRTLPLLLALVLLLPGAAFAAEGHAESEHINYIVDTFNEENGLPTGEANTLLQADNGYLWIGSYGGLLRYDGSSFTDFSDRLMSSAIRALFESSDGTLYIGTNDAGMYRFRDDVFTMISAENVHSFLCIRDFAEAPDGTIYTASTSGIARVDGDTLIPCAFPGMEGEQFLNIAVDRNGVVWAMSGGGTLYLFRGSEFLYTIASDDILPGGMIYSVGTDKNGVIYVPPHGLRGGGTDRPGRVFHRGRHHHQPPERRGRRHRARQLSERLRISG